MAEIKLKGQKIWKTGTSNVITVPATYLNNGQLELGREYEIVIRERLETAHEQGGNGSYGTSALDQWLQGAEA